MKKTFILFQISLILFPLFAYSQTNSMDNTSNVENVSLSEIFVTGLAVPTESTRAGVGITVITNEQLEAIKPNSMEEILRKVPGLQIKENSSGKLVTLYMRGVSTGVAVMIDGMPINDTAGVNDEIDLSSLPIDNIERIEIIKGAVGASLGSSAMNGAVNIITKKGGSKAVQASSDIQSMLWKLNMKGSASIYGTKGIFDYRVGGSYSYDENISAAGEKYGNYEKDPDAMGSFNGYFRVKPTANISTDIQINYVDRESAIDDGGGAADNIDYLQRTRRVSAAWNTRALLFSIWEPQLKVNYTYSGRTYGSYEFLATDNYDIFDGHAFNIDFYNNVYVLDELTLTAGVNYEYNQIYTRNRILAVYPDIYDTYTNDKSENNYAGYIQATANLFESWTTVLSFRVQKEGVGFENGLFDRKLVCSLSWFDDYYTDMISWKTGSSPSGGRFENDEKAHIRGIEADIGIYPFDWLDITAGYTWMQTFDADGYPLERRPEHQFQAGFVIRPIKPLMISADIVYVGESVASTYDMKGMNDDYFLLNAVISYDINDTVQVYLKGKNLTDTDYEEIAGYGTKGIEVFIGAKIKI